MVWSSDFRDDASKEVSRDYNVSQVQLMQKLFNRHTGKLKYDWAELAGVGAPTLGLLRGRGMLGPAKFLGIECDERVYIPLVEEHGESGKHHKFFHTELEAWVGGGSSREVGVLNFDSQDAAGSDKFAQNLEVMIRFANRQVEEIGAFALIINAGFGRGYSLDTFKGTMREFGITVSDRHLQIPGVLYGGDRKDRNSSRVNYCVRFGHATPNTRGEQHGS